MKMIQAARLNKNLHQKGPHSIEPVTEEKGSSRTTTKHSVVVDFIAGPLCVKRGQNRLPVVGRPY